METETVVVLISVLVLAGVGFGFVTGMIPSGDEKVNAGESEEPENTSETGNMTDQERAEQILEEMDRKMGSELSIELGYEVDGYIILTVKNIGDRHSLPVEKKDIKLLDLRVDGNPESWTYVEDKYRERSEYSLSLGGQLAINTTVNFPEQGESKQLTVSGPFETRSSLNCYGEGSRTC